MGSGSFFLRCKWRIRKTWEGWEVWIRGTPPIVFLAGLALLVWVWNEVASGYGVLTDVFVCLVGCIMAGVLRSGP
jgi:hypothetical protein